MFASVSGFVSFKWKEQVLILVRSGGLRRADPGIWPCVIAYLSAGGPGSPHSPLPDSRCQKDSGRGDTLLATFPTVSKLQGSF